MAYSFDQVFAADPANPANIASNAAITIYQPGDPTKTPLVITDTSGGALTNPIPVNANGFGSAFMHATLDRVAWDGGGFTGFFTSYEGMKNEAVDARTAAQEAAATAGAEAAVVATAAIGDATADAAAAATSAATAQTAAAASATAAANSAALVGAPADSAIAAAVNNGASATKTALDAAFANKADAVPKWKATTAYVAGDKVVAPSGDIVSAKVNFTSAASYSAANWNYSTTFATSASVDTAYSMAVRGFNPITAPLKKMIVNTQAGHGITISASAGTTSNLNDTTDFSMGTQAVSLTTIGTAGAAFAQIVKTGLTARDMTGEFIRIWIKFDSWAPGLQIQFYLGSDSAFANSYNGQIFNTMGNIEAQSNVRAGEWTALDFPTSDLTGVAGTPNLAAITAMKMNVQDTNSAPQTFHFGGMAVLDVNSKYPNGVVSLTFDDTNTDHYTVARPKMDTYGFAGTLYPIIDAVDTSGRMTLAQMKDLINVHGWDMGGHASTTAAHTAGLNTMTEAQVKAECEAIRSWMAANQLRGDSFAWPLTYSSTTAEKVVSNYFRTARGGISRTHETLPPNQPMRVRAIGANASTSLATLQAAVDGAKNGKAWTIITFHGIKTSGATGNDMLTANFNSLIDYINTQGVAVQTVSQVMARL